MGILPCRADGDHVPGRGDDHPLAVPLGHGSEGRILPGQLLRSQAVGFVEPRGNFRVGRHGDGRAHQACPGSADGLGLADDPKRFSGGDHFQDDVKAFFPLYGFSRYDLHLAVGTELDDRGFEHSFGAGCHVGDGHPVFREDHRCHGHNTVGLGVHHQFHRDFSPCGGIGIGAVDGEVEQVGHVPEPGGDGNALFPVGYPVDEPPDLVEQFVPAVLEDRRHGVGDVRRLFPPFFAALGIEFFIKKDGVGDDGVFPLGIVRVGEPGISPEDGLALDGQLDVAAPRKVRRQGDDLRQRVEIEVLSSLGLGDPLAELRRAELDGDHLGGSHAVLFLLPVEGGQGGDPSRLPVEIKLRVSAPQVVLPQGSVNGKPVAEDEHGTLLRRDDKFADGFPESRDLLDGRVRHGLSETSEPVPQVDAREGAVVPEIVSPAAVVLGIEDGPGDVRPLCGNRFRQLPGECREGGQKGVRLREIEGRIRSVLPSVVPEASHTGADQLGRYVGGGFAGAEEGQSLRVVHAHAGNRRGGPHHVGSEGGAGRQGFRLAHEAHVEEEKIQFPSWETGRNIFQHVPEFGEGDLVCGPVGTGGVVVVGHVDPSRTVIPHEERRLLRGEDPEGFPDEALQHRRVSEVQLAEVRQELGVDFILPGGLFQPEGPGPRPVAHGGAEFLRPVEQDDDFHLRAGVSFLQLFQVSEGKALEVVVPVEIGDDGPIPFFGGNRFSEGARGDRSPRCGLRGRTNRLGCRIAGLVCCRRLSGVDGERKGDEDEEEGQQGRDREPGNPWCFSHGFHLLLCFFQTVEPVPVHWPKTTSPCRENSNRPLSREPVSPGKKRGDHDVMVAQGRFYFNMEDVKGL